MLKKCPCFKYTEAFVGIILKNGKGECFMYIADLHIHSRYSRATSRDLTPERLDLGARFYASGVAEGALGEADSGGGRALPSARGGCP